MKKCMVIPDSFKGTISAIEFCEIVSGEITKHFPACEIRGIPVADGGEGTVESFLYALNGKRVEIPVKGPYFEDMTGFYGINPDGTAVIEMAAAAGLPLVGDRRNARKTTTYGVGQLIADAVKRGCKNVVVGLGGSATNDAAAGAAAAFGVKFYNKKGEEFVPVGETLSEIDKIDVSAAREKLKGVSITAMCDIDNPMYGPTGAAYVFGPQKGADPEMVEFLDRQLRAVAAKIKESLGMDVSEVPGSGAAGAMGAGMMAFFGAKLHPGIDAVLDTIKFEELIRGVDMIITGEGRIDTQSLRGKVVIGIARRAKAKNVPVVAVVGDIGDQIEKAYDMGVSAVFSTNRLAIPFSEAKKRAKTDLALTADNIMRFAKTVEQFKK